MDLIKLECPKHDLITIDNREADIIQIWMEQPSGDNQVIHIPRALIPAFAAFFESQKEMTKKQAQCCLEQGAAIQHEYFGDNEFLYMENGKLKNENHIELPSGEDYWQHKINPCFNKGWKVVSKDEFK